MTKEPDHIDILGAAAFLLDRDGHVAEVDSRLTTGGSTKYGLRVDGVFVYVHAHRGSNGRWWAQVETENGLSRDYVCSGGNADTAAARIAAAVKERLEPLREVRTKQEELRTKREARKAAVEKGKKAGAYSWDNGDAILFKLLEDYRKKRLVRASDPALVTDEFLADWLALEDEVVEKVAALARKHGLEPV